MTAGSTSSSTSSAKTSSGRVVARANDRWRPNSVAHVLGARVVLRDLEPIHRRSIFAGVPDTRIEQARRFLLSEVQLSPRKAWVAAIDPAMPESQAALQLEFVCAYLTGDVESILAHADPDVVIKQAPEVPDARTYCGRDGMLEALLDWPLQWERFALTPRRIYARRRRVGADGRPPPGPRPDRLGRRGGDRLGGALAARPDHLLGDLPDRRGRRSRRPAGRAARGSPGSARPWPSTRRRGPAWARTRRRSSTGRRRRPPPRPPGARRPASRTASP